MATYTIIASNTLGSDTATVTFSAIPQTFTDLIIMASTRVTDTNYSFCQIRLNGDTGTSYNSLALLSDGSSPTVQHSTTTSISLPYTNTASNTANTFGSLEAFIANYTSGSQFKSVGVNAHQESLSSATNVRKNTVAANYTSNTAITSITFIAGSGTNFLTGSTFYLYGV
jgi:hypothetical protein